MLGAEEAKALPSRHRREAAGKLGSSRKSEPPRSCLGASGLRLVGGA